MLAHQDDLSRDALLELGKRAGLDVAKLRVALDQRTYQDAVSADVEAGKALEIQRTPSFVINGRKIVGSVPLPVLRAAIDSALND